MKIIIINNLYGKYARGGAEAVIKKTEEALKKENHDVSIFSTYPNHSRKKIITENNLYYFPSQYFNLDKIPLAIRLFWHISKINDRPQNKLLKKEIKKINPDLIITHNLTGFTGKLPEIIKKLEIKHLHYLHDIQLLHPSGRMCLGREKIIDTPLAKIWQKIKRKQFNYIKYVICPSNWLLELHQKKGFFKLSKTLAIPNPLNLNYQKEKEEEHTSKNYTFIYLGQIDKAKGLNILLSAFNQLDQGQQNQGQQNQELIKKEKKINLKIIGNGKDFNELKDKYKENDNIIFTGRLEETDFNRELSNSNCLVLPSLIYENSPTAIFDALINNLNIIASNLGGIPEIIKKYYGYVFEAGNEKDLIEKMKIVIGEKENKKAELKNLNSANYINTIFSWLN